MIWNQQNAERRKQHNVQNDQNISLFRISEKYLEWAEKEVSSEYEKN